MKVLLIGGSGILSTDVCKTAISKDYDVYVLNRGKRKYALQKEAHLITCDILREDVDTIREKLKDLYFDTVIDFLSFNPEDVKRHLSIIKDHCSQYVFISSATVYEKQSENEIISEETPIGNSKWQYALNKANGEKFLKDNYQEYCSHWTVIRPYVTYNETRIPFAIIPGHANWTLLKRVLENKPIVLWDSGQAKCTITHSRDFSVGVVGLFGNPKAFEEAFHITSDFVMDWKQVLNGFIEATGKKADVIDLSTEYIIKVLPEYSGVLLGDKGTNMVFDNSKIKSVVADFKSTIPFEKGIKETVQFFYDHKELQVIDYKWEGRLDYLISKYYRENKIKNGAQLNIKNYPTTFKERLTYFCYKNIVLYNCIQGYHSLKRKIR